MDTLRNNPPPPQKKNPSPSTHNCRGITLRAGISLDNCFSHLISHSDRKNGNNRVQKDGREERGAEVGGGCVLRLLPINFWQSNTDWAKRENQRHTSVFCIDVSSKNTPPLFLLCSPFSSSCETELVARKKKKKKKAAPFKWPLNSASETEPSCLTCVLPPWLEIAFKTAVAARCLNAVLQTVRGVVPGHELHAWPQIFPVSCLHARANATEMTDNPHRSNKIRPGNRGLKKTHQRPMKILQMPQLERTKTECPVE